MQEKSGLNLLVDACAPKIWDQFYMPYFNMQHMYALHQEMWWLQPLV